ncbi:2-oxoacid:acceptor oxidoreductase subunit alpha [Bacteroidota bacterium]
MGNAKVKVNNVSKVVVKFAGDSGDGIQLVGEQFSDTSAFVGHDLSTFPDYPSEIRAPQGTVAGVSGFQIQIGDDDVETPGDQADILVALNPAALKANMSWLKPSATVIIDIDNFDDKHYKKAGFIEDPLGDGTLDDYKVIKAPISSITQSVTTEYSLEKKKGEKLRNQFITGMLFWLFDRELKIGEDFIRNKFKSKPEIIEPNIAVLKAGYNYAETVEANTTILHINPVKNRKGLFRNINGNTATAWGLMAAAEKSNRQLFLGSYPITPASEILHELSKLKQFGVITFQAEDEIAGITSAIGASFAGKLGATSTSGPGLSLKSEAIGLAVITELPLVVVDVQRGGPSTGLPTKTEQSDLMQALYGRHGESPCIVLAASTPGNCFHYAYMASKLAMEHMTPVILLTDGYLANGSELWNIPSDEEMPEIRPPLVEENSYYRPYHRDIHKLSRFWAMPGQKGLRHKLGGLEKKAVTGEISYEPLNHEFMTQLRKEKVNRVVHFIPKQEIEGDLEGDLLMVGWGGTYGAISTATSELRKSGYKIGHAHFHYIHPFPKNTEEIFKNYRKILVCELNDGQFADYLTMKFPRYTFRKYNKIQGLPFMIAELKEEIKKLMED